MARKDVTDCLVCFAYSVTGQYGRLHQDTVPPPGWLRDWTGAPEQVWVAAMERARRRGLVHGGVSLRAGWLTEQGKHVRHQGLGIEGD
jgi:hypothetical protein